MRKQQTNIEKDRTTMKQFIQSWLKHTNESNAFFGDNILHNSDDTMILFHNINGIKDHTNWAQVITTMQELGVGHTWVRGNK
jgi:hypothetical protein